MRKRDEQEAKRGFWRSTPGILTGIAGVVGALATLITALTATGVLRTCGGTAAPELVNVEVAMWSKSPGQTGMSAVFYVDHQKVGRIEIEPFND